MITDCPFCIGDEDGCCFCDHSGKIRVGEGDAFFKNMDEVKSISQPKPLESDLRDIFNRGGFDNLKNQQPY